MVSLSDCIAFSGMESDEIRAIARYEHVSEVVAAGLCSSLIYSRSGIQRLRRMVQRDAEQAAKCGDLAMAKDLRCASERLRTESQAA
jgi:hypothetical protein